MQSLIRIKVTVPLDVAKHFIGYYNFFIKPVFPTTVMSYSFIGLGVRHYFFNVPENLKRLWLSVIDVVNRKKRYGLFVAEVKV